MVEPRYEGHEITVSINGADGSYYQVSFHNNTTNGYFNTVGSKESKKLSFNIDHSYEVYGDNGGGSRTANFIIDGVIVGTIKEGRGNGYVFKVNKNMHNFYAEESKTIKPPDPPRPVKCSTPTNFTVPEKTYVNTDITLSWSASKGNIANYEIEIRLKNTMYTCYFYPKGTSFSFQPNSLELRNIQGGTCTPQKNDSLLCRIRAISRDSSNYNSDYTEEKTISIVNSPPTLSKFSISGKIIDTSSEITINDLDGTDADLNDDVIYYYNASSNKYNAPTYGWIPLSSSKKITGLTRENHFIYIKAYDGFAYSNPVCVEAEYGDEPPVISQVTMTEDNLSTVGGQKRATRKITINASFNKQASYTVFLKPKEGNFPYKEVFSTSEYYSNINDSYNIESLDPNFNGKEFIVRILITSSDGQTGETTINSKCIIATQPTIITSVSGQHVSGDFYNEFTVDDNILGSNINISFVIPGQNDNDIPWKEIKIGMEEKETNSFIFLKNYSFSGNNSISSSQECYIANKLENTKRYKPKIIIIDNNDRESSKTSSQEFSILPVLSITQGTLNSVSIVDWNVYDKNKQSFTLQKIRDAAYYHIYGQIQGEEKKEICRFRLDNESGDTIIHSENSWELFKQFGVASGFPKRGIQYFVKIENKAKVKSDNYYPIGDNCTITSQIAPTWNGGCILKRGYLITNENFENIVQDSNIINENETISAEFDQAPVDLNDTQYYDGVEQHDDRQTLKEIRLQYTLSSSNNETPEEGWQDFATKSKSEIYNTFKTKKIFQTLIPHVELSPTDKKYIFIRAKAIDEDGLYCTINCGSFTLGRTTEADFNINTETTDFILNKNKTYNLQISGKCSVNDYGGSNFSESSLSVNTDNFSRQDSSGYAKLYIRAADSLEKLKGINDQGTLIVPFQEVPIKSFSKDTTFNKTFEINSSTESGVVYIQSRIKVYKSGEDTFPITTEGGISVIYLNVPTVSLRKNAIGINQQSLDSNSIIEFSSLGQNKKNIVFNGFDSSGTITQITLDLNTRQISNLIIDGGTWDGTS